MASAISKYLGFSSNSCRLIKSIPLNCQYELFIQLHTVHWRQGFSNNSLYFQKAVQQTASTWLCVFRCEKKLRTTFRHRWGFPQRKCSHCEMQEFNQWISMSTWHNTSSESLISYLNNICDWDRNWLSFSCRESCPSEDSDSGRVLSLADILDATRGRLIKHALNQHWQPGTNTVIKMPWHWQMKGHTCKWPDKFTVWITEVAPFLMLICCGIDATFVGIAGKVSLMRFTVWGGLIETISNPLTSVSIRWLDMNSLMDVLLQEK